jgi:hypothetical protein
MLARTSHVDKRPAVHNWGQVYYRTIDWPHIIGIIGVRSTIVPSIGRTTSPPS